MKYTPTPVPPKLGIITTQGCLGCPARPLAMGGTWEDITGGLSEVTSVITKPVQDSITNTALIIGGAVVAGIVLWKLL